MHNSRQRRLSVVILVILVAALVAGWTQRYPLYDWWRLRDYDPPAEIVQLADDIRLNDYGRRLLYVNRPELNDEKSFQQNCTVSEATIVLGCYVTGKGIYLFRVTDDRLAGVHQVTAAHEMLHAAYERLSSDEKERVNALTQSAFVATASERLQKTIQTYETRDPAVVPNELHSIMATEVAQLPAELETYYSQYFTDRQAVVNYSKAYEAAFEERKNKVAEYDRQLSALKEQINSTETDLDALQQALSGERQSMDALLAAGRTTEYNARVPGYNSNVRQYNNLVAEVRLLIDRYNSLVAQRNAIAVEENELLEAIDSRPDTIPTQ